MSSNESAYINNDMKYLMNKLFIKSDNKKKELSEYFNNPLLEKINSSKHYDEKNQKYNIDEYNLLIRENEFNNKKSIYGWRIIDGRAVNINVSEELIATEEKDKIFDLLMKDFINRNKITISKNSVAGQIYKALDIDVSKYSKQG